MIKEFLKRIKFVRTIYMKLFNKQNLLTNEDIDLNEVYGYQDQIIKRIKSQDKIKVAFFISTASKWKYEYLYRLLKCDNRFEVKIVIVPMHGHGEEFMIEEMLNTYNFFKDYGPIKTYDEVTNQYFDIKKESMLDVIFYSEPYDFVGQQYHITNFYKTSLCCHVQYAFMTSSFYKDFFNRPFHTLLWKFFVETEFHKNISKEHSFTQGLNVVVTGYPGCDVFLDDTYRPKNIWIKMKKNQFKIIWAPHHTINESFGSSNFLELHEAMLELAANYKDKIFIIFKPHPNLKPRLYKHKDWGKSKTDNYYNLWNKMENTQVYLEHYGDLFITSDALIHDSSSFIVEYLYVNKPVLFIFKSFELLKEKNIFGLKALDVSYKAYSYDDIKDFIENIIINDNDYKKIERELFLNKNLIHKNKEFASDNIYNYLCKHLTNNKGWLNNEKT